MHSQCDEEASPILSSHALDVVFGHVDKSNEPEMDGFKSTGGYIAQGANHDLRLFRTRVFGYARNQG